MSREAKIEEAARALIEAEFLADEIRAEEALEAALALPVEPVASAAPASGGCERCGGRGVVTMQGQEPFPVRHLPCPECGTGKASGGGGMTDHGCARPECRSLAAQVDEAQCHWKQANEALARMEKRIQAGESEEMKLLRQEVAALNGRLEDALLKIDLLRDLAAEGIGYTSPYFRDKWDLDTRLRELGGTPPPLPED